MRAKMLAMPAKSSPMKLANKFLFDEVEGYGIQGDLVELNGTAHSSTGTSVYEREISF